MARRIFAVLLFAMAAGQISDITGFVDALDAYQIGGRGPAWVFAVLIVAGEAASGVNLLRRNRRAHHLGATLGLVVAVAWTILGTQAFARGLALENCGCFGVHLAQPLRWWVLVQDAELIALAWWVRRSDLVVEEQAAPPVTAERPAPERIT